MLCCDVMGWGWRAEEKSGSMGFERFLCFTMCVLCRFFAMSFVFCELEEEAEGEAVQNLRGVFFA